MRIYRLGDIYSRERVLKELGVHKRGDERLMMLNEDGSCAAVCVLTCRDVERDLAR